jgi:ATP-dependent helicase/nuclease subunit B
MAEIAKNDSPGGLRAFHFPDNHPAKALWVDPQSGLLPRVLQHMKLHHAHPARTVVLLPYAQLLPLAARLWGQYQPDGFAPRFETTMNWVQGLGGSERQVVDMTFDMGLDVLTAQGLLDQAGWGGTHDALAPLLVQSAHQLAALVAAVPPGAREAWAHTARHAATQGRGNEALAWESVVARIAVEWAAASGYASDVLYSPALSQSVDLLVMVRGYASEPLASGLAAAWGARIVVLDLHTPERAIEKMPSCVPVLHACLDAEDEAQRAVACAMQHIAQGRFPVALVSSDRALTRRMRAMLEGAGVAMRDENGWKLSTSSAAASVMAMLRACAWNASADAVLDWLKLAPAYAEQVDALEALLRRDQVGNWRDAAGPIEKSANDGVQALRANVDALREEFTGRRPLAHWLELVTAALQRAGLWEGMRQDGAGEKVLLALHVGGAPLAADRRMDLTELTRWVNAALEGASFQPVYPALEQVVFLPLSQLLGRPFAAVVLAGCDEVRLNPGVEPQGLWTSAQRKALGLPSREALEAQLRAAWDNALQAPECDLVWRTADESGEVLQASPLVQWLDYSLGGSAPGPDWRVALAVEPAPVTAPQPRGDAVPVLHLSASSYEDLRQCPYRFFALRQLGLRAADELESDIDQRDFGLWLHAVLHGFHGALSAATAALSEEQRRDLLNAAADAVTQSMNLPAGGFLPFFAAWPAVRDGYLKWLADHESQGAAFASGETPLRQTVGEVALVGRIDRIDHLPQQAILVLDYKTESPAKTKARVKEPLEDTQIAFYAALLPDDTLRAAYVNVGERDGTVLVEQKQIVQARDALIEGVRDDMARIRAGAVQPALGEGVRCEFCDARGLCRKDFWDLP